MAPATPSLVWVMVDGEPRHVSEFASFSHGRRPRAHCPQCGRRLTLKLGEVLQHHAAHAARDSCAATNPETALHLNCKLAIAAALRAATAGEPVLSIVQRCADQSCTASLATEWVRGWTEVRVEQRVTNARRPDILLYRHRDLIGVLEIVASNAVSPEKARALHDLHVSWIEVRAEDRLTIPGAWHPQHPLAVLRTSDRGAWRCDTHAAREAATYEARRRTSVLRAARVVDAYHERGARDRFIYRVSELLVDGVAETLHLQRGTLHVFETPRVSGTNEPTAEWSLLRVAFAADVKRLMHGDASFADSPMRWASGDVAENIVDEALADRVGRDVTPLATRYPRRWFYAAEQGRWFLPADMRNVRWDRPQLDAFAAHPAWSRERAGVRERPAPEGSWQTPVFANRPLAAMFGGRHVAATRESDNALAVVEIAGATKQRYAIVIAERRPSAEGVTALATRLAADSIAAIWISHPLDWRQEFATVAWAPAGRDWRGVGGVIIDGLGVFRADQLARALAKGDPRLTPEAVRERMSARVARMLSSVAVDSA